MDWDAPFGDGGFPVSSYVETACEDPQDGAALGAGPVSVNPSTAWKNPGDPLHHLGP